MSPALQLMTLTEDVICVLDEKGNVVTANDSWKKLFPTRKSSIFEHIHNDNIIEVHAFLQTPREEVLKIAECKIVGHGGKTSWVTLKMKHTSDNKFVCVMKDITHVKNSLSVLDYVSEIFNFGEWIYDGTTLHLSGKVFEILNKDPSSFEGTVESFMSLFEEKYRHQICEAMNADVVHDIDLTVPIQKRGINIKWLRILGRKEFLTGAVSIRGIIQDVTKDTIRDVIQLSLNVELNTYEKALENLSIISRTDPRGMILHTNEAFCRISGYSEEELMGKNHNILNSGYHPKSFFEEMWKAIKKGECWRGKIKNKAKDGSYYWVDNLVIPIRDSSGDLQEILSLCYNITELMELKEEVKSLKAERAA